MGREVYNAAQDSELGFVSKADFQKVIQAIGVQMGKDEAARIGKYNELVAALNNLNDTITKLAEAQNMTAQIVDSIRLCHEYCMEKLGGGFVDEGGMFTETDDFKTWCQKRIDQVEALATATQAQGEQLN